MLKITGQVYTSLVQNYEQTRIQEAKDSMDIQIIDAADLPKEDMPAKPNKKINCSYWLCLRYNVQLWLYFI